VSLPSARYRQLALGTAVATFLLIIVGGVVRVSGSGLGCGPENSGFHGWPFCNGDVVPGVNLNSVIEYSHRTLAGAVAIAMIAMAVIAWRRYRSNRALVWSTTAASGLIVVQGLLGAATVEEGLDKTLVATHLGLAMALLALAVYAWRATRSPRSPVPSPQVQGRALRPLAIAASVAVFCTIVAGGYMAGTQKYGRPDYQLGDGAHHACGKQFPSCNGEFMPFGKSQLVDIHLAHRAFMYLASLLLISLIVVALRRRPSPGVVRSAYLLGGLLVLQILLGALNVWLDEYEALIVAHLAAGTLLWTAAVGLAFQLYRVPAPIPERETARPREAVTA
jgi:heme A synthase